jgi:hypothetical protein
MPQFDGLFDFQNNVRPAYFTFKLLARLTGDRLRLTSSRDTVHGLAARDDRYTAYQYNLLLWNYAAAPTQVEFVVENAPGNLTAKPVVLDAATPSNMNRPARRYSHQERPAFFQISFEPYGVGSGRGATTQVTVAEWRGSRCYFTATLLESSEECSSEPLAK